MNKVISLFCLVLWWLAGSSATAQPFEPKIKFTLRFEDAIGNKDSVIVGYDSLANSYIDSIFGEIDLTEVPFDSVFEVRGADKGGQENLSKIIAQYYASWFCEEHSQYQSINIYAKHFPVRITWDSTYFEHECYDWTHFTRSWSYLFHPNIFNGYIIRLKEQSAFLVTKEYLAQTETYRTSYLHSIEGGTEDSIFVMFIGLAGSEPTDAVEEPFGVPVKVSPNPAMDEVRLEVPEGFGKVAYGQIFSADGQSRWLADRENAEPLNWAVNLAGWPPGLYTVKIVNAKGKMATARFIKT